jgi:hypothetical protein
MCIHIMGEGEKLFFLCFEFNHIDSVHSRLMPTLTLGAPCAIMEGSKYALLVITITGQLHSW